MCGASKQGRVYSHGGIAPGAPDRISGGVFVVHGAYVDLVRNRGPVMTYGANDMVLDNWGMVDRWVADDKITSHGPSGIGFVNFGTVNMLAVDAPIETFGQGARGFNVYTGTVNSAQFERIVTHADGAVGIQISRPVGRIKVRRGIETFGGAGDSLVKGGRGQTFGYCAERQTGRFGAQDRYRRRPGRARRGHQPAGATRRHRVLADCRWFCRSRWWLRNNLKPRRAVFCAAKCCF
jgi:hypothetical protein